MKSLFATLFLLCLYHNINSQNRTFPPKNEVNSDSSLASFVRILQKAIDNKDENQVISMMDKNVASSFGDEEGVRAFVKEWDLNNDSSLFWPAVSRVISLGGVFLHDEGDETGRYQFVFPYTYAINLEEEDDYFNLGLITGKNVNLRQSPDPKSKVITQLSYNVISYIPEEEGNTPVSDEKESQPEWYHIRTLDSQFQGWVNWKYVYNLMGPRLFLYQNDKGQWKISAFLVGD
jgi:hypothetical protein